MAENGNGPTRGGGAADDEQRQNSSVDATLRHPFIVAAELLADSPERERLIFETAWAAGYRTGFETGVDVGRGQAEAEMTRAWMPVAERVRHLGRSLDYAELELRRWDGPREDFGKPRPGDYMGGPVPWGGRGTAA